MKNILVFPCGSEIGLEVQRALAGSTHFKVVGASSVDDHGKFAYEHYVGGLPDVSSPQFLDELEQVIARHAIDFIVPAHDAVVLLLAVHQHRIAATVITSPMETCRVCRSKRLTYEALQGVVPTPRMYGLDDTPAFPVFLKPDVGQGSKGVAVARTADDLRFHEFRDPTLLRLEYLPGKEYTVDCFTDRTGRLLFCEGRERRRIHGGISVNSVAVADERFRSLGNRINEALSFRGVWFFQVKARADGELVLMEIAPRLAGTMSLFRVDGVNFVQLSLFDRMGMEVEVLRNGLAVEVDRALSSRFSLGLSYDTVYIDLDDTVLHDRGVNPKVMQFLYQSRNASKKIHLLTRHRSDVTETLSRHAICAQLFDDVQVVQPGERKSDFVLRERAIFIDDSFAERRDVHSRLGLPVFSVDAIEALLT